MRRNGLIAIGLDDDDELLAVDLSDGDRDIILATHDGMAVHFNEKDVRPMGRKRAASARSRSRRATRSSRWTSKKTIGARCCIVTSQAFGKRTPIADYRHTSRGGKGVKAFAKEKDIGYVVDQILVRPRTNS